MLTLCLRNFSKPIYLISIKKDPHSIDFHPGKKGVLAGSLCLMMISSELAKLMKTKMKLILRVEELKKSKLLLQRWWKEGK